MDDTKAKTETKASQVILVALLVLSSIGLTGILSRFDGLILLKVGIEGGQILIDGRQGNNSLNDSPAIQAQQPKAGTATSKP